MTNKVKDIDTENCTYYFFNDMIKIKNVDPNNIKKHEKPYKNVFIYYIGYVRIKDLKYKYLQYKSFLPYFWQSEWH